MTGCAAQVFRTLGFKLDLSVSNISPLYTLSLLPPAQYWRLKILRRRFILHNSSQLLCCLGNQINLLLPQTEYIFSDNFFHDDLFQFDLSKSFFALSIHPDLFCIIYPNCSAVWETKSIYCFLKLSTFSLIKCPFSWWHITVFRDNRFCIIHPGTVSLKYKLKPKSWQSWSYFPLFLNCWDILLCLAGKNK